MSTHEDLGRTHEVEGSSDRSFGVVFTVVFLIVALLPLWKGEAPRLWALAVSAVFLLAALARPVVLRPLNRAWLKFGLLLGRVVNPIVMAVIFYLVITPVGLVVRLLGKDPLRLRLDREAKSYWIERDPPGPDPRTMSKQF